MNQFQDLFDRQKRCFATGVTRSHGWRIEQLDRMSRLVAENEAELQKAIGAGFQDRQPGADLRDACVPGRGRIPEEPAR
jgi:hypothetical protein